MGASLLVKLGICGHFGNGKNLNNGQTIKTRTLTSELQKIYGNGNILKVDTHGWKNNPLILIKNCIHLLKESENIIILPAQNGVKVFIPLFFLFNFIFKRNLHYIVIGGWLPEILQRNTILKNIVSRYDGIYVETYTMIESLKKLGLDNVRYLPNFKRITILKKEELVYRTNRPYKLCTFSRVMEEKGIEDAINAVTYINEVVGETIYKLDIYGQIEPTYKERFKQLIEKAPEYISYKGVVDFNNSVNILKNYFALLFPTYYKGEGFAGTVLDAFSAGVPVIATNWRYNGEIISHMHEGVIYDYKEKKKLQDILYNIYQNPDYINDMKINCLKKAEKFSPDVVMRLFSKYL